MKKQIISLSDSSILNLEISPSSLSPPLFLIRACDSELANQYTEFL